MEQELYPKLVKIHVTNFGYNSLKVKGVVNFSNLDIRSVGIFFYHVSYHCKIRCLKMFWFTLELQILVKFPIFCEYKANLYIKERNYSYELKI